jgi:hypothetical protein
VFVDGKHKGSESRFINHSCDPNLELERFIVKGKKRIGIFAIRDVKKGEPLSYDYQFDTKETKAFKCFCGSENCRGTMAPKMQKEVGDMTKLERRRCIIHGRRLVADRLRGGEKEESPLVLWGRLNCTGAALPGDPLLAVAQGPPVQYHRVAREGLVFLPRVAAQGGQFWARRKVMWGLARDKGYAPVVQARRGGGSKGGGAAKRGRAASPRGGPGEEAEGGQQRPKRRAAEAAMVTLEAVGSEAVGVDDDDDDDDDDGK